ncbi:hypothetical protein J6590_048411 [Homalodisca vitripennis]|nr:hypothetical protein J6590_048411 [Homalodisca vitripennis]
MREGKLKESDSREVPWSEVPLLLLASPQTSAHWPPTSTGITANVLRVSFTIPNKFVLQSTPGNVKILLKAIRTVFYNDLPPSYGHGPRVWSCQGRCPARTFTVTHLSHRTDHCGLASSTILRQKEDVRMTNGRGHKEERIEYRNHNLYDEPPLPTPSLPSLDRYR